MKCLNCNKEIKKSNKYCSNKCQKEYEYKSYIEEWKTNKVTGLKGEYQISNHIKTYLFNKYNKKCAKCGWGETNKFTRKIPLEVEHIDGNYMNNSENNLILLCPNCHSYTENWRGRGKKRAQG